MLDRRPCDGSAQRLRRVRRHQQVADRVVVDLLDDHTDALCRHSGVGARLDDGQHVAGLHLVELHVADAWIDVGIEPAHGLGPVAAGPIEQGLVDPALHLGVAVIVQRERVAAEQPAQAGQPRRARIERHGLHVGAPLAQRVDVRHVLRVVDEGAEEELVLRRQVAQQVVGAHLVALVGRVGHAVHEVEDLGHAAPQPRLRTT